MTSWFFKYKYTPIIINRLFALKNFKINIISTSGLHIKYLYSMPEKKICYKLKLMTNNWLKNLGSSKKRLFHILKTFSLKKKPWISLASISMLHVKSLRGLNWF